MFTPISLFCNLNQAPKGLTKSNRSSQTLSNWALFGKVRSSAPKKTEETPQEAQEERQRAPWTCSGWCLEHEFYLSIAIGKYSECHHPNWLIDIFRGAQPPTSGDMIHQAQHGPPIVSNCQAQSTCRGVGSWQLGARVWHLGVGLFNESKFDQRIFDLFFR